MGRCAVPAAAIGLTVAIFGPALAGSYVWDDTWQVEHNHALRSTEGLARLLTTDTCESAGRAPCVLYHPLPMATVWLQARTTGQSIVFFRLGNLAIHWAAACLLFVFLRRRGLARPLSLAAGALFLVHPSVTEPVMWVVGRQDSLATVCSVGALVAWPDGTSRRGWLRAALASLLLGLALLCKEPFVVVAALLLVRAVLDRVPWRKSLAWLAWPIGAIAAIIGVRHALGIPSAVGQGGTVASMLVNHATILWHYLAQLATFDNGPAIVSFRPLPWPAALGVFVVIVAVCVPAARAAWLGSRRAGLLLLGVLWFVVALAPHVVSLPAFGVYGNRYAYFPLMGLLVAGAAVADGFHGRLRPAFVHVGVLAFILVLAVASLRTAAEARAWKDEPTFFSHNLDPEDGLALHQHANVRLQREGCEAALPELARVVELAPGLGNGWHNLAGCLLSTGRHALAVGAARRALALQPRNAGSEYNLGAALVFQGQIQQGIAHLERAARLDPGHVQTARLLAGLRATPPTGATTDTPR
jgi:hypothetical protein